VEARRLLDAELGERGWPADQLTRVLVARLDALAPPGGAAPPGVVDPGHRRAGLASAVMAALWQWGAAAGAVRGYLQVSADNAPAVALYSRLGYWLHHEYHYRTEPEGSAHSA
jgi:ribosomal protein S18 acetylase RimI-like enzyme